ncbi:hydantoinase/oxoprolinase family protein [Nonomuraea lactucae]|uniref:hydantoinase/oxoprolinase family protein n=1 Tax=Nonomuraea lactucae TaxID=2249762 RepID=UPI001F069992|nr:hydantoinase/oxoprolinase family protein [Nonomuraea lactucae]
MAIRIGIDVGGTNTDAVMMSDSEILAWVKVPTTADVGSGAIDAVAELLNQTGDSPQSVSAVMIGTTQFTNALIERRSLERVAAVRLSLPANTSIPIACDWPDELRDAVGLRTYLAHGGSEFDGRDISPINERELIEIADDVKSEGIVAVAISSVFSPVSPKVEGRAAEIIQSAAPGLSVTLSHEIGRLGLLERENASILNASLTTLARHSFANISSALTAFGLNVPVFISQNDGTVMSVEFARRYPIRTVASGPTNSMRGAAFLSGLDRCLVLDVGGTTTDVGALSNGFPRESPAEVEVAGVRTNFRMPDVLSIAVGGGSLIRRTPKGVTVGPESVGYEIVSKAHVFGGSVTTATDVAVAAGLGDLGDKTAVAGLEPELVRQAVDGWHEDVNRVLDTARPSGEPIPLVLVGGGSLLVDSDRIDNVTETVRPRYYQVANAVGAAIPQASGEVDKILSLETLTKEQAVSQCRVEAIDKAVAAGADPDTVEIVELETVPVAYFAGVAIRVRVRAIGNVSFNRFDLMAGLDPVEWDRAAGPLNDDRSTR